MTGTESNGTSSTASPSPDIYISGFLFSHLLNEAAQRGVNHEGLLYGEHFSRELSHVSDDNQETGEEVVTKKEFVVQNVVACQKTCSFYSPIGKVMKKPLSGLLSVGTNGSFIGWYMVRRNTHTAMSMRERNITDELLTMNTTNGELLNENCLFLLITPSQSDNASTHQFAYKCFLCSRDAAPVSLKLNIINLGGADHVKSEYMHHSKLLGRRTQPHTDAIAVLQDTYTDQFTSSSDSGSLTTVDASYHMMSKTIGLLRELQTRLLASRAEANEYRYEIEQLKQSLACGDEATEEGRIMSANESTDDAMDRTL